MSDNLAFYRIDLYNNHLFKAAYLHFDKKAVTENYMSFQFTKTITHGSIEILRERIDTVTLRELGARVILWTQRTTGQISPLSLEVTDYRHITSVVKWLFNNKKIKQSEMQDIQSCFKTLQKCAAAAPEQSARQILEGVLEPYFEDIIAEVPSLAIARKCIEIMAKLVGDFSENTKITDEEIVEKFHEVSQIRKRMSPEFYTALIILGSIYQNPESIHNQFKGIPRDSHLMCKNVIITRLTEKE